MIRVDYAAREFIVRAPFQFKDRLKEIPSRQWNKLLKAWTYPATSGAAGALAEVIGPPGRGLASAPFFDQCYNQFVAGRKLLTEGLNGHTMPPTRTKPFQHQKLGYQLIAQRDGVYLAWEMGTMKTATVIYAIGGLGLKRCLVLCPKSVVGTWPGQWQEHGDPAWHVEALDDKGVAERARRARSLLALGRPLVLVLNYEAAWREPMAELLLSVDWDMVCCDEGHKIKDPNGAASKFVASLAPKARRRVILSGTPMPSTPLDLFAQMRFVDPGVFGQSFFPYKSKYTVPGGFQGKQVVAFKQLDDLNRRFYAVAHRIIKSEVLDLPPQVHTRIEVDLSHEAAEVYRALENDFVASVQQGTITVDNALTELLRLQQVTGGSVKNDAGELCIFKENAKRDALQEIFEDLPAAEPVVVFGRFHADLDAIHAAAARCGRRSVELSGRKNEIGWKWMEGDNTVAAVQIQAGGVGVDLCRAAYCVYYSLDFSHGDFEQSKARVHRQGQKRSVTYIHLLARKSIDERIYKALSLKEKVIQTVLRDFEK